MDEANWYKDDGPDMKKMLDAYALWLSKLDPPLYDFGWDLTQVPEPNDEQRRNK
jgi:hypothetical protein